ncbi:cytochrome ubiquinol oxidase subunit I [Bacillus thuringiensis]
MGNLWGKLFRIKFVMGIISGIRMELEFGRKWCE